MPAPEPPALRARQEAPRGHEADALAGGGPSAVVSMAGEHAAGDDPGTAYVFREDEGALRRIPIKQQSEPPSGQQVSASPFGLAGP